MELNRRDFLKGGAVLGGAAAMGSLLGGCSSKSSDTSNSKSSLPVGTTAEDFAQSVVVLEPITKFKEEKTYDIIVIGAGT
ncbi:MAG: twin-arginine translocation signal domain-containing protein, partial [Actinobacteria bacterium]|nr:twin-arginine translocation signal domain-containing protein [Actinomycetota bacterium]